MTEGAKRLGYNKRVIRRHFPDLCRAISAQHLQHKKQMRAKRIEGLCRKNR